MPNALGRIDVTGHVKSMTYSGSYLAKFGTAIQGIPTFRPIPVVNAVMQSSWMVRILTKDLLKRPLNATPPYKASRKRPLSCLVSNIIKFNYKKLRPYYCWPRGKMKMD